MRKLRVCELSEIVAQLPELRPVNLANGLAAERDDLFLCALGFEPRCLVFPEDLERAGYNAGRAVYMRYATNPSDNDANLPRLRKALGALAADVRSLEADATDFADHLRALVESLPLREDGQAPRVTLDCSVTANRLLMRCLKILLEADVHLRVFYAEAAVYHPTREEYESNRQRWESDESLGLERGVSDVSISKNHPGHHLDPLPDCIFLFPTFKAERSRAVIGAVDQSLLISPGEKIKWLLGVPHLPEDSWRVDAMMAINRVDPTIPRYELSTFSYKETLQLLERLYLDLSQRFNITVSPIGSKMQALGVSLFCYLHPDVRIMFATPKEYNAVLYSEGSKAMWEIAFGPTAETRKLLELVGTLSIDDDERSAGNETR